MARRASETGEETLESGRGTLLRPANIRNGGRTAGRL